MTWDARHPTYTHHHITFLHYPAVAIRSFSWKLDGKLFLFSCFNSALGRCAFLSTDTIVSTTLGMELSTPDLGIYLKDDALISISPTSFEHQHSGDTFYLEAALGFFVSQLARFAQQRFETWR